MKKKFIKRQKKFGKVKKSYRKCGEFLCSPTPAFAGLEECKICKKCQ